jgi:NADPH-dependent 2,4-dienoyl-CoA reductase/sulfur reductase-like enzyme
VIEGVGVQPELGFAHDLPLAPNGGGIAADESLCALEHVWVAGDIANVNGTRIEHWRLAQQHGQIAALSMLGRDAKYDGVPFFWTFHFGKRLGYLGHANQWDEIVTEGDIRALAFVNLYVKDAVVKAVLTCGQDSKTALLAEMMRTQPTLAQVRLALA